MKSSLIAFAASLVVAQEASALTFKCPPGERVASGITTAQPKTSEQLHNLSVTPPIFGTPDQWDLDLVSNKGRRKLFLSCVYKDKKAYAKLLPSTAMNCKTLGYSSLIYVECEKRG